MNKWGNIAFVGVIIAVFVAGFFRTVFFPKEINYYENRYSNKITTLTIESALNNNFQESMEDALSDQIPGAQRLKKIYNETMSTLTKSLVIQILESNLTSYIGYKNGLFFGGYYVYTPRSLDELKPSLEAKANNYNSIFEKYPSIDFYVYYIEKDTDVNFETGDKLEADEYLFSLLNLDDKRERTFEINDFEEFSDNFYKTDHHWNHKGSYKAYLDVLNFLGCEDQPVQNGEQVLISRKFMGSKAISVGSGILKESFYAYKFNFPNFESINGDVNGDYGTQCESIAEAENKEITTSYGEFYGGDNGEIIFTTGKIEHDNILIIGESYDNAILKLLATHFNKTCAVDLRNYEYLKNEKFNFEQYVKTNEIDKVLFIGNVDFYLLEAFNMEDY